MSNEKCSAGHERCYIGNPGRCPEHGIARIHCIHGTPIGQECKEGPQPKKMEGLKYARLAIVLEDLEGGSPLDKEIAATIRAKDEEIAEERLVNRALDDQFKAAAQRADLAEAKVTELEGDLKKLMESHEFQFYRIMYISEIPHIPESERLTDMKAIAEASRAKILETLTPKQNPPPKWPGDSNQRPLEGS